MGQSFSCEANSLTARQEIPHPLWYSKVPYHVHKSQALDLVSQVNADHILNLYFFKGPI
jgi:hypothetical protein